MEIRINVEGKDGTEAEGMREALVEALEGFFGLRPQALVRSGKQIGYVMNSLSLIDEPGEEMAEWRRVALSKWRHYKEMIKAYEKAAHLTGRIPSSVAITIHEARLARMIPYLLGMPEEALEPSAEIEGTEPSKYNFGPYSGKIKLGDPHHHEERTSTYPVEGLDFSDSVREDDVTEPRRPLVQYSDPEPGMWERADYEGGQDEVRVGNVSPAQLEEIPPETEYEPGVYLIERGKHPGEH